MFCSFLPATNLLFYVGFVVAERVLYIPSIGFCLLLGHVLSKKATKNRAGRMAIWALLAILAGRTVLRNQDWKDEESLYRSGVPINPAKGSLQNETFLEGCVTLWDGEGTFSDPIRGISSGQMRDIFWHLNLGDIEELRTHIITCHLDLNFHAKNKLNCSNLFSKILTLKVNYQTG